MKFFWGLVGNIPPPNTYSAALARGLPSKGEIRRASIHEQYDVGTGGRLGKARKAETSGTGETGGSASRTGDYGTSETSETSETGVNKKSCF